MRLSEIGKVFGFAATHDHEIENLKLLFQEKKNSLIFASDCSMIEGLVKDTNVNAIIAPIGCKKVKGSNVVIIPAKNPADLFYEIHEYLLKETDFYYSECINKISPKAQISPNASIAAYNVTIEEGVVIGDFVRIESNVHIGAGCIIKPGVHIGGDGLCAVGDYGHKKTVSHAGSVFIGSNTVVGSNAIIERGLFKDITHVGDSTIIGALVVISHNSRVGKNCVIASNAIVCGSVIVHDNVTIDPNATIAPTVVVHEKSRVGIGTVVLEDVPEGRHVIGRSCGHIPVLK
ncbi:UDP-3-O-[3-hydroxymyristoyl] glucosamine N-acyltransferase [Maridesulfovibrio ferrireducens]|uniref:UDP-3-O-[3-hydroxymyristoyl] glucosamine N-acyltransferase n=1 Tax=Maridesulfovibrio ferrireducens TaxID=246191 RepID=A0A1G9CMK9_9BACT|nr:hypothetical protein [Maridesulfovibrio ferrireducens]SDK52806.1 UDP-3-O-[3-hydroxymyristoyl] glucosamine N-acyltransferase [Maridesulfovibrio ferrireducens]